MYKKKLKSEKMIQFFSFCLWKLLKKSWNNFLLVEPCRDDRSCYQCTKCKQESTWVKSVQSSNFKVQFSLQPLWFKFSRMVSKVIYPYFYSNFKIIPLKYDGVSDPQWTLCIAWSASAFSLCSISNGQNARLVIHFHRISLALKNAKVIIAVHVSMIDLFSSETLWNVSQACWLSCSWPVPIFSCSLRLDYPDPMELLW